MEDRKVEIKIYKPDECLTNKLMVNINDENDIDKLDLITKEEWIKVNDLLKLINDKIEYLKQNELYPAFGLNSQVEELERLKDWFEIE